MARRRRKGNNDSDLATLLVGGIFLLSFAYTQNMEAALRLGITILLFGGAVVGLVVYLWRRRRRVGSASTHRSRAATRNFENTPLEKLEREVDRQSQPSVAPRLEKPVEWSLDIIRSLEWKRFEELCAGYFQATGSRAKATNLGPDGGIDVLLYGEHDPEKLLGVVQCKAWAQKPVGVKEIRELFGVMTDVGCPHGIYIATSGYTADARSFTEGKNINLMDAGQLLAVIQQLPMESRTELLQKATTGDYSTPSCPKCGVKLVSRTSRKGNNAGRSFWGCSNFPRCRYTMHRARSA